MVGRLMFLVNTNIWLELLLEQEKADEVRRRFRPNRARQKNSRSAREWLAISFSVGRLGGIPVYEAGTRITH